MGLRHLLIRARHGLLLAALLCVLLARIAVPAGWMPIAGADGRFVLAPCSGMGTMKIAAQDMPGMDMPAMTAHHADKQDGDRHPDPAGDHPCSGAGVAAALETPLGDVPTALALQPVSLTPRLLLVRIGQGLAAPPPPQTGPPNLV